jgi:hypothetical protein
MKQATNILENAMTTMVKNRMVRLCHSKSLDTLDPPDEPPGPLFLFNERRESKLGR